MEIRSERMEPELEGRRDPEVPAGAAHAPEQLRLLDLARPHEPAVGRDQLDRGEVVDRQAELPLQPAHAATQREPGDAGVAHDADRADEAVRLGGDVELAEERAAVRTGGSPVRVHDDSAHRGQVHDQAASAAGEPGQAVPAGPDGDLEVVVPAEADRGRNLRRVPWPDDGRGTAVVQRVPQPTCVVVGPVRGRDDVATERPAQLIAARAGSVGDASTMQPCPPCGSRSEGGMIARRPVIERPPSLLPDQRWAGRSAVRCAVPGGVSAGLALGSVVHAHPCDPDASSHARTLGTCSS